MFYRGRFISLLLYYLWNFTSYGDKNHNEVLFNVLSGEKGLNNTSAVWQQFQSEPQRKVRLELTVFSHKLHDIHKCIQEKDILHLSYSTPVH